MSLTPLLDVLVTDPIVRDILTWGAPVSGAGTRRGAPAVLDIAVSPGARPPLIAALAGAHDSSVRRPILAVTATGREAEDLVAALRCFLPAHVVADFPSWETLPHERLSPRSDTVGRRLAVLRRLAHPDATDTAYGPLDVVVVPVRALLQPLVRGLGDLVPVALKVGDETPMESVVDALAAAAYVRTDLVERRGEFAVRGGILDVFSPTQEHPLRIEFWGDRVEEIRWFKVADQRSLQIAEHGLWAPPCREILPTEAVRQRAAVLATQLPGVADMLGKVAEGIAVEGMESLAPALVDGMESLLDVLAPGTHVVLTDPERVRKRAHDLVATSAEFLDASWANAVSGNAVPVDLQGILGTASYWLLEDVRAHALETGRPWWSLTSFGADAELAGLDEQRLSVETTDMEAFRGDTDRAVAALRHWAGQGWHTLVVTDGHGLAKRVSEVLSDSDVPNHIEAQAGMLERLPGGLVQVTTGALGHGFIAPGARLVVVTESDLSTGSQAGTSTKDMRRMPVRRRNQVDPLDLRLGDYVVHEQHGVGKFVEMVQRTVGGATREYLLLEYGASKRGQPADRLFVPTDQLDQVTRYVGGEAPTLHKLGGADWAKTKGRAKKHVKQIAGELIRLYSARMATKGHAFGPDTPWQLELEDAFVYVETPDQLSSIDEVKMDMEREVPMDRLICGDVGYGKTEIAVRAAFKAIQDGKQAAILVPTTILAQQHYGTFSERYAPFPVVVKALSRFQSDAEASEVVKGLADGTVDLVIGTHRLLSDEIAFRDLGLVVVDEEQRFGVEHKEKLKRLRTAVDVLALSATPIPRTLEMAVTGIREMSTLATPPEERHPVLTFVGAYDEKQIIAAIRRELVPEARIATAHGQMPEHKLEQVVVDFWEKRFDVLVCTTIIETGLDISNANTLIVERADVLGLSQLHQLRGRVGRGRERAYSYFLYPPEKPLTETAHDRLATIASHTDLGAGMAGGVKEPEVRGAGNRPRGARAGHIAGVGFDLYIRLVGEAVADFRGEGGEAAPAEIKIELPVDAHLPHEYVPGNGCALRDRKKLATVQDAAGLAEIEAELQDRYGTPPEPVRNLFEVARLRTVARKADVGNISVQGNFVRFGPLQLPESKQLRLQRLYPGTLVKDAVRTILVPRPMTARVAGQPMRDTAVLRWASDLIEVVLLDSVADAARVATAQHR